MTQVLNQGIFSVESLTKPRHQFPNYHALYFLSPTEKSIKILTDDFKDKPKYSRIHLYFTHQIDQDVFDKLVTNGIVKRTVTCKELNLSYIGSELSENQCKWANDRIKNTKQVIGIDEFNFEV